MSFRDFYYSVYFLLLLFVFLGQQHFVLLQIHKIPSLMFLVTQEVSGMGPSIGLSQISFQQVTSTSIMSQLPWHILETRHCCRSKDLWSSLCLLLYFCSIQYIPVPKMPESRGRSLCRHWIECSMFTALCRCCLQQWGPTVSLWIVTTYLGNKVVW